MIREYIYVHNTLGEEQPRAALVCCSLTQPSKTGKGQASPHRLVAQECCGFAELCNRWPLARTLPMCLGYVTL